MLYIVTSDWHVRGSNPKYRVDDYSESILNKIGWIVRMSNKYNADIILSGDIFNSIKVGTRIINRLIRILKKCKNKIYSILGQHDEEFHSNDLTATPYLTLMEAGVITNLGKNPINNIYGIGWGEDVPDEIKTDEHSVLSIHHLVTHGDPAFFLEDDGISAEDMLDSFPEFKFIVTGDYHTPHVTEKDGRILINSGCIGRSNKDQYDFKPRVYLLDTEQAEVEELYIPVRAAEDVFSIPEKDKVLDDKFAQHIQEIIKSSENKDERPDFITTVRRIMKAGKYTPRQVEIGEKFYSLSRGL
jgi:DNA repair exonuclease SbcCD nuclease subunit